MNHILYLASQSLSRKNLLMQADIPFIVFPQSADEHACDWTLPLEQLVQSIAVHKMNSLDLSMISDVKTLWVLTADTLGQDALGNLYGKPFDSADARRHIIQQRNQWSRVATSFCLDRKSYRNGVWHTEARIIKTLTSEIFFAIDDHDIDAYIQASGALSCAGSITVDGVGGQYLKEIKGSYSAVIGLPLYELRQALIALDFFTID